MNKAFQYNQQQAELKKWKSELQHQTILHCSIYIWKYILQIVGTMLERIYLKKLYIS